MIKKYTNGSWTEVNYRKYGTEADTITTLPKTIIADGTSATATIKGNLSQSGTPTPSSPIYPSETGNKTANLCNADTYYGTYKQQDGTYQTSRSNLYNVQIKPFTADDIGKTFTFSGDLSPVTGNARLCANVNGTIVGDTNAEHSVVTFTVATVDDTIFFNYGSGSTTVQTISNIMLNEGQPMNYEPYGYKIPILSGDVTTPVYLGQVQSTRQIKKYEFTGQESFGTSGSGYNITMSDAIGVATSAITDAICSHYQARSYDKVYSGAEFGFAQRLGSSESNRGFSFSKGDYESSTDFKTYLQQQYAAGTPVTVWYVLATPTTGIVNEPIRKIGTYSDSISNVTQIPTTAGSQTFDVDTTLKPSEVDLTYHGWHEHEPKKYEGGWS